MQKQEIRGGAATTAAAATAATAAAGVAATKVHPLDIVEVMRGLYAIFERRGIALVVEKPRIAIRQIHIYIYMYVIVYIHEY